MALKKEKRERRERKKKNETRKNLNKKINTSSLIQMFTV